MTLAERGRRGEGCSGGSLRFFLLGAEGLPGDGSPRAKGAGRAQSTNTNQTNKYPRKKKIGWGEDSSMGREFEAKRLLLYSGIHSLSVSADPEATKRTSVTGRVLRLATIFCEGAGTVLKNLPWKERAERKIRLIGYHRNRGGGPHQEPVKKKSDRSGSGTSPETWTDNRGAVLDKCDLVLRSKEGFKSDYGGADVAPPEEKNPTASVPLFRQQGMLSPGQRNGKRERSRKILAQMA